MCSDYYRERGVSRGLRSSRDVDRLSGGSSSYRDVDRALKRYDLKEERYVDYYGAQSRDRTLTAAVKEEYRTLCLSNLNHEVQDRTITEAIHQEFRKFGEFNIKLVQVGAQRRIAYVNFKYPEDARDAKYARENKLVLFDMPVRIDPVFPKKRQDDDFGSRDYFQKGRLEQQDGVGEREIRSGFDDRREPHHKFPHHLHHVQPEDDDKATRTLFVGNLEISISVEELRDVFERYGFVEDVDIKKPTKGPGNAYAFIRFQNLDMAHRAKVDMSGRYIGKLQCKIGYGKANATNCLWIGGLGPWVSTNMLEAEFDRFGVIRRIYWNDSNNFAFVLYDNQDAALAASKEMRGFPLGGQDRRLRIDFADPETIDAQMADGDWRLKREEWQSKTSFPDKNDTNDRAASRGADYRTENNYYKPRSDEVESGGDLDRWKRSHRDSDEPQRARQGHSRDYAAPRERNYDRASPDSKRQRVYDREEQRDYYSSRGHSNGNYSSGDVRNDSGLFSEGVVNAQNVHELAKGLPVVWSGALVLKTSAFSARMHLVSGNVQLVDTLMRDQTTTEMSFLKITQRLRLDQPKLDDMARRVSTSAPSGYAILLAMTGSETALEDANAKVQHRPLKNLVSYLKQKDAAGVISLPPNTSKEQELGVLHAFPPCPFGQGYLTKRAPMLSGDMSGDDHLVVIVVGGSG